MDEWNRFAESIERRLDIHDALDEKRFDKNEDEIKLVNMRVNGVEKQVSNLQGKLLIVGAIAIPVLTEILHLVETWFKGGKG